jgi:hypothetical protein
MSNTSLIGNSPPIFALEVNLSTLTSGLSAVASLVNRSGAIVSNPSDYYVSVTRLVIGQTQRIPMWQPQLNTKPPYNDGYNTVYAVNLEYSGVTSGKVFLRVINEDNTVFPPADPSPTAPLSGWGDVYSYNTICQMVNNALVTAYAQLVENLGVSADLDPNPPYMTWNPSTELFTMNCFPMSQYDQSSGEDVVKIYFNNTYRPFLLGWGIEIFTNEIGTPSGMDNLLILRNTGNNYTPQSSPPLEVPLDSTTVMLQMSQDISAPFCFVALSKIQVVASLPTAYPCLSDLPLALQGSAFNNQTTPILMDVLVNYSNGGASSFQQPISYSATSDIWSSPIKLGGTSPISQFGVVVQWVNIQGQVFPVQTMGLGNSSIKFVFTHKSIIEKGL